MLRWWSREFAQDHWSQVVNLVNGVAGVTLVSQPWCLVQAGPLLGLVLLFSAAVLSSLTTEWLLQLAHHTDRSSYQYLALSGFGSVGQRLVEIAVICTLFGVSVAVFVMVGDLAPEVLLNIFPFLPNSPTFRFFCICTSAYAVALPLSLQQDLRKLAGLNTASLVVYVILAATTVLLALTGHRSHPRPAVQPSGALVTLPLLALSLAPHTQVFEVCTSVTDRSAQRGIVRLSLAICVSLYAVTGLAGALAFDEVRGDILINFPTGFLFDVLRLLFLLSLVTSFPLLLAPIKTNLFSLLLSGQPRPDLRLPERVNKHLTTGIVTMGMLVAVFAPGVESVLAATGATTGLLLCYVMPCLLRLRLLGSSTAARLILALCAVIVLVTLLANGGGNVGVPRGDENIPVLADLLEGDAAEVAPTQAPQLSARPNRGAALAVTTLFRTTNSSPLQEELRTKDIERRTTILPLQQIADVVKFPVVPEAAIEDPGIPGPVVDSPAVPDLPVNGDKVEKAVEGHVKEQPVLNDGKIATAVRTDRVLAREEVHSDSVRRNISQVDGAGKDLV